MSQAREASRSDDGLSLIETIIALFIVAVVMTSSGVFFINGMKHSNLQSQRQTAITLANQALEAVQAVDPKKLVNGRTQADVTNLLATAGSLTAQDITSTGNYDASPTAPAVVPTQTTKTVSGVPYLLRTFIDLCYVSTDAAQVCTQNAPSSSSIPVYRATVVASWTPRAATCPSGCSYAVSALIDKQSDPKFNTNLSEPKITGVSPASAAAGTTRTLTIDGSGYVAGARVDIAAGGGSFSALTTNTGTQLVVTWTAGPTPGSYGMTVVNPDGGRTKPPVTLTVTPAPTITSIGPSTVRTGTATPVTITGTGFQSGVQVGMTNGSVASATFVSSTSVTAVLTPTAPYAGSSTLTLTNPDGGVGSATVTVVPPPPTLTGAVQSATAPVNRPVSVTLTGTGFVTGTTVTVDTGSVANLQIQSSTSAAVTFTPTQQNTTTTFTVTTLSGTANTPSTITTSPAPQITGMNNTYGKNSRSGTFTLSGTGFTSPAVTVSGVGFGTAGSVTAQSATSITFTVSVPNGGSSTPVRVTVTIADGQTATFTTTVTPT